jgi:hypothetical protein
MRYVLEKTEMTVVKFLPLDVQAMKQSSSFHTADLQRRLYLERACGLGRVCNVHGMAIQGSVHARMY